jgi:hypothetical protein
MPDPKWYLIFTAVTAIAVLIQACVLLAIGLGARAMKKKLTEAVDEVRTKALPVIEQSRVILAEAGPKVKTITDNLVQTTETLKKQGTRVDGAVDDVLTRTRHQVARVDAMVANTLDAVQHATNAVHHSVARAGESLQHAVDVPTRHITGVFNAVGAAVDKLFKGGVNGSRSSGPTRYRRVPPTSADVAAAGRPVVTDKMTEPLVPPGI